MQAEAPVTPYEVRCTRCRVSFPLGTRTCIHCGGRIGRAAAVATPQTAPAPGLPDEDLSDQLPTRAAPFSPMTLLWLLAGVATVVYRACHQP